MFEVIGPMVGSSYQSQNPEHLLPRLESMESRSRSPPQHAHLTNGNQTFRADTAMDQAARAQSISPSGCAGRLNRR